MVQGGAGAEKAWDEIYRQYQLLLESLPLSVVALDRNGNVLLWNRAAEEMFGWKRSEVLGRPIPIIPDEEREAFLKRQAEILNGKEFVGVERKRKRKDGTLIFVKGSAWPLRDSQNRVGGSVGTFTDLTELRASESERERLQEGMRQDEERYRLLFESSPLPMWVHDRKTFEFLAVNKAALHHYGYTREELQARTVVDLRLPEERSAVLQMIPGEEFVPWFGLWKHRKKDGAVCEMELTSLAVTFSGREARLVVAQDVTAREESQRLLRESEKRYRSLVENVNDIIYTLMPAGGPGSAAYTRWVNPRVQEILGYAPDEFGQAPDRWEELLHPDDRKLVIEAKRQLFFFGKETAEVYRVQHKWTRQYVWLEDRAVPQLDELGNVIGAFGVVRDVTDRMLTEEILWETNRQLDEALAELKRTQGHIIQHERLRALGTMASGIAHDFNNALAPILGFSELLLEHPESMKDLVKVKRALQSINLAAKDASRVVSRMREFYRHREPDEVFASLDLGKVIHQAVSLTQPKWKDEALASGSVIELRVEAEKLPPVLGSEPQLRELLINLMMNAVDAMPSGGSITIGGRGEGGRVILEVSDTGTGMSEEVRSRCLEPFFTTKGTQGTGLGLAMVAGIVKRHEGTLEIRSQPDAGTTFILSLPAAAGGSGMAQEPESSKPRRLLRVLLVDDDPLVREVVEEYLRTEGHAVESAGSGREALEKFHPDLFDLVISDRGMPEINGDRLAAMVKQQAPEKPFILLTGFGDMMKAANERPPGVDLILSKPVTLKDLREALALFAGA